MWATSVIFKKLPKVNNRPMGENSPHLVTLSTTLLTGMTGISLHMQWPLTICFLV
jgi:hypothetical protein